MYHFLKNIAGVHDLEIFWFVIGIGNKQPRLEFMT
jgi:hypothetical protein